MTLDDILTYLRTLAPEEAAMASDPVGLLIGREGSTDIDTIGVCLDATPEVAQRAVTEKVQLVIAHHPLIYQPLRRIMPETDPVSRSVVTLIKHDIALYAMHTNWDKAQGGINDTLAVLLGLSNIEPFGSEELPRIGDFPEPISLGDFFFHVQSTLGCAGASALRVNVLDPKTKIKRVAVCGGAGAFLMAEANAAGADAYVTSDVRHHEFLEASGRGVALLDAGHGATETPGMRVLAQHLTDALPRVTTVWLGD